MFLQTGISFEKDEFRQDEAVRGHVDIDIDQYQAPPDGRRDDYTCKFKIYGQFSFQQPDFRKSTLTKFKKRQPDAMGSWQAYIVSSRFSADPWCRKCTNEQVDGTAFEYTVYSRDCPYHLKPGQAARVRSIPFSFHMPTSHLPASFISTHGRAKIEYVVSCTTSAKKGAKHTCSSTFVLLAAPVVTTTQVFQHNFNVDVENGGQTCQLSASVRNIITVSYPTNLLQNSFQNMTISFPDERFTLQDINLRLTSKLSIHAVKSTFIIEEDTTDIPCTITDPSTRVKILSIRVPSEVIESLKLTMKKCTVRKEEILHVSFNYFVSISPEKILYCTSACQFAVSIIGVPPSQETHQTTNNVQTTVQRQEPTQSQPLRPTLVSPHIDSDAPSESDIPSSTDDQVKRSSVPVLRGILKKPRRFSLEPKQQENHIEHATEREDEQESIVEDVPSAIGEIDHMHSDSEVSHKPRTGGVGMTEEKKDVRNGFAMGLGEVKKGSLQLAALDRRVFAKRGQELRDEYMREMASLQE